MSTNDRAPRVCHQNPDAAGFRDRMSLMRLQLPAKHWPLGTGAPVNSGCFTDYCPIFHP